MPLQPGEFPSFKKSTSRSALSIRGCISHWIYIRKETVDKLLSLYVFLLSMCECQWRGFLATNRRRMLFSQMDENYILT